MKASCRYFWQVWMTDFAHLQFRTSHWQTVCPVCTQHRCLLKLLGHDTVAWNRQRLAYDRHLQKQYQDRRWYWFLRAQSRLVRGIICIIIDGMDQAKFCWPRAPVLLRMPLTRCTGRGCMCGASLCMDISWLSLHLMRTRQKEAALLWRSLHGA